MAQKIIKEIGIKYFIQQTESSPHLEVSATEYLALTDTGASPVYSAYDQPVYDTPDGLIDFTAIIDEGATLLDMVTGERTLK